MVPILGVESRNGIGSALSGLMVFIEIYPPNGSCSPILQPDLLPRAAVRPWSRLGPDKFKSVSSRFQRRLQNKTAASRRETAVVENLRRRDQLLRSPSAVRFHCITLSEIIRVDFIAAWLSWA
ncbi:hypothetical protein SAMN05444158_6414 [Bradyrhizobium canariense]|uniref:Uncharacterized protein n=1 Tax=Bradyrhizobium canariense TaxID=255045 RepID=A0A1H2ARZ4_9BRAD|nr:hypothetical protein SAMN05444158_6414 [Bradyrhizobium canariense]